MWTSVSDCCIKIAHQITRRKSVLYVCERVNGNLGASMAMPRDPSGRHAMRPEDLQRPQQHSHGDPALNYPYQVALPDGEIQRHEDEHLLRLSGALEQEEITRGYIKPPENRCLCQLEQMKPQISCSMGLLPSRDPYSIIRSYGPSSSFFPPQKSQQQHRSYSTTTALRHSSHLDSPHYHQCHKSSTTISSISSTSSSSLCSWPISGGKAGTAAGDDRNLVGRKHSSQKNFMHRQKHVAERLKRLPRGGEPPLSPEERPCLASGSSSSCSSTISSSSCCYSMHSHSPLLACPSEPTALSDIASLPCGTAHSSPHSQFVSPRTEDQLVVIPRDRQSLQGPHDHPVSPTDENPPLYSDLAPYKDQSCFTEHRTGSDNVSP